MSFQAGILKVQAPKIKEEEERVLLPGSVCLLYPVGYSAHGNGLLAWNVYWEALGWGEGHQGLEKQDLPWVCVQKRQSGAGVLCSPGNSRFLLCFLSWDLWSFSLCFSCSMLHKTRESSLTTSPPLYTHTHTHSHTLLWGMLRTWHSSCFESGI